MIASGYIAIRWYQQSWQGVKPSTREKKRLPAIATAATNQASHTAWRPSVAHDGTRAARALGLTAPATMAAATATAASWATIARAASVALTNAFTCLPAPRGSTDRSPPRRCRPPRVAAGQGSGAPADAGGTGGRGHTKGRSSTPRYASPATTITISAGTRNAGRLHARRAECA